MANDYIMQLHKKTFALPILKRADIYKKKLE